jgi:hypothetical protein
MFFRAVTVLKTLAEHIRRKRPELHPSRWRLHHDNERPHVSKVVAQYLARKNIECVPHTPYIPNFAPCDFFLFPRLKSELRGPAFRLLNGRSEEGGGGSEDDVKKWVPARLPGLADTLGQVHTARWGLL